jgi:aminopeptidase N
MDDQAPTNLVKPRHYDLELRNLDFENWKYDGIVSITVEFIKPSRSITINATHLNFKNAQVLVDGDAALTSKATSFDGDDNMQVVRINLDNEIPATKSATIIIAFQGAITDSLAGFYRSKYKPVVQQAASVVGDADGSHYALSTQFQASYARRAFPCFDVPNLKATFALAIEVPSDQVALSNMPVRNIKPNDDRAGWHMVSFETSPVMSTYLLAWAVGDFAYVEAFTDQTYNGRRIPVRVYAVRGLQSQGQFALTLAPRVIDLFSGVFDIPYPLDKMDLLAVPEMSMNSMEHWGLITSQPSIVRVFSAVEPFFC